MKIPERVDKPPGRPLNTFNLDRRTAFVFLKFAIWALIIIYLWKLKFFLFVFVWCPTLLSYVGEMMIEYGVGPVLRAYAFWWYTAIVLLIILAFLLYDTAYRIKRRDFIIGGEFEGRVVWIKGVRQGLIYDAWDASNWLRWKFGKKKGAASRTPTSSSDAARPNGTAYPSPWDIPIGPKGTTHYVFYIRRWYPIPPIRWAERWFIPVHIPIKTALRAVMIGQVDVERRAHPTFPGHWDYHVTTRRPRSQRTNAPALTKRNRQLLKRSAEMVEHAIGSDSETKKSDYVLGSFDIPVMKDEDGKFDD